MKNEYKKKWNDDLVKDFVRICKGSKDYWEYMNLKTIDKKLDHFKKINDMGSENK